MNTKTILNIKTDKKLKKSAKETAEELGIPLSTAINAFLKQFVREKEITISANRLRPTSYLQDILRQVNHDLSQGEVVGPLDGKSLVSSLRKL